MIKYHSNEIYLEDLKNHMKKIAKNAIKAMPYEEIEGKYYDSGYDYPSISDGWWNETLYSWEYTKKDGFNWTPEYDGKDEEYDW